MEPPAVLTAFTAYPWDHALALLRVVEPARAAGLQFVAGGDYGAIRPETISTADLVVIQRDFPRFGAAYERVLRQARLEGKPVIFELDDLLLEMPEDHPDRSIHYYTEAAFPMLRAIAEADAITVTTAPLAAYLRPFHPRVYILPNALPDALWAPHFRAPVSGGPGPVTIGYMGSDSHAPDLALVAPALRAILDANGERVRLQFWGAQPPEELRGNPRVGWTALNQRSYVDFVAAFSQLRCDVWIAPLRDDLFNRCKSAIKYLEYAALGIPGVYARVLPYESVVRDGENGLLAGSPAEWTAALQRLIDAPELRQRLAAQAQCDVRERWMLSQHADAWRAAYQAIATNRAKPDADESERRRVIARLSAQAQSWTDALAGRLAERERTLQEIYGSGAWKLVQRLWRARQLLRR